MGSRGEIQRRGCCVRERLRRNRDDSLSSPAHPSDSRKATAKSAFSRNYFRSPASIFAAQAQRKRGDGRILSREDTAREGIVVGSAFPLLPLIPRSPSFLPSTPRDHAESISPCLHFNWTSTAIRRCSSTGRNRGFDSRSDRIRLLGGRFPAGSMGAIRNSQ